MSGDPIRRATSITAGPYDGRSGVRLVAQRGTGLDELEDPASSVSAAVSAVSAVTRPPFRARSAEREEVDELPELPSRPDYPLDVVRGPRRVDNPRDPLR